jgi:hypothetical protein
MKKTILACVTSMGIGMALVGGYAAARPADNVSAKRHPNIAAAQRLVIEAFEKVSAAQKANEFDMQGHAAKAKQLLDDANTELKQAAEAANAK